MTDFDPAEELLIPAVYAAAHPIVTAAREVYQRPLPRLRSQEFLDAPRVVQQAVLIIAGEAWVFGDPMLRLLREASDDVHGGDRRFWREWAANRVPFAELKRRRAA